MQLSLAFDRQLSSTLVDFEPVQILMRVDDSLCVFIRCKTATGLNFVVGAQQNSAKFTIKKNYKLCLSDWVTSGVVNSHQLSPRLTGAHAVSSIYVWSENLVAESEAKDGGN